MKKKTFHRWDDAVANIPADSADRPTAAAYIHQCENKANSVKLNGSLPWNNFLLFLNVSLAVVIY